MKTKGEPKGWRNDRRENIEVEDRVSKGVNKGVKLRLHIVDDAAQVGAMAADLVIQQLQRLPSSVLALPTGRTPVGMYQRLVEDYRQGRVDFSSVKTFNLDEFYGLDPENPASYASYMRRELFDHVNLLPENRRLPDSKAEDADRACREYEQAIQAAGGLDLAILGIGSNGHIAFNEPGSSFESRTRLVNLRDKTVADNAWLFASAAEVPRQALTMGLGTIMEAREILLLACGPNKAEIVARALCGPISIEVPASVLQRHKHVTVIVDKEAAADIIA